MAHKTWNRGTVADPVGFYVCVCVCVYVYMPGDMKE